MQFGSSDFLRRFFGELEEQNIPYVILHSYEQFPESVRSDVDFAVLMRDLPKLAGIERTLAERHGWRFAHSIQAHIYSHYAVVTHPQDSNVFVQLDACAHYVEHNCFFLRDAELLADRRRFQGFFVPAPATEFAYLLAKAFAKGQPLAPRLPRLRELWERDPMKTQERFRQWFCDDVGTLEQWFEKSPDEWEQLRKKLLTRSRFRPGDWFREASRAVKRVMRPTGLCLAVLGSDGSGKSTLLERVAPMIDGPFFRRRWLFHFRPKFFERRQNGPPVTDPHGSPPRNRGSAALKLLYYFCDHLIGYFARVFPAKVRNELVIFDRNFDDIFVDPRRYRFHRAGSLARWLGKLLPRADLTLILDAEAEQIHARKPELPVAELQRQRLVLRQMARENPRCIVISAAQTPDEVAGEAYRTVIQFLAERESRRQKIR